MEKPKETLVIYRLKFKSEHDFEKAVQILRFGQNMGKYIESLQRSFALQRPQLNYPMTTTTPPEVNFCKDDLVIYFYFSINNTYIHHKWVVTLQQTHIAELCESLDRNASSDILRRLARLLPLIVLRSKNNNHCLI